MIEDAKTQAGKIVKETEIVQMAQKEAENMIAEAKTYGETLVNQAQQQADEMINGAQNYVDSILSQLEVNLDKISMSVKETRTNFNNSREE